MPRVLIRFTHGLGDCVQFSVVLKHLARHRPNWQIDVRIGRGKEGAMNGLCRQAFHDQQPQPPFSYDQTIDISFFENYNRYQDRPNSKITNCLAEQFGLGWDHDLGRYEIRVREPAFATARKWLTTNRIPEHNGRFKAVLLHYEGNTSSGKKNLQHWQARDLTDAIIKCGRVPVILDWDCRSPLIDHKHVLNPGVNKEDIWGGFGSGDAEILAALIRLCEAFIGIDSGPGKVASSTDTPTCICWMGHHPIQFHDPAENTLHLVPENHRSMSPISGDHKIANVFEQFYRYRTYGSDGMIFEARRWLEETLGVTLPKEPKVTRLLLPNGIGDVMWALLKVRNIVDMPIDIDLSGNPAREVDQRAIPFLKRFPFVREVRVSDISILKDRERPTNEQGRYDYIADGKLGNYHVLIPNRPLEHGQRIEEWLPDVAIDWDVIKEFSLANTERGECEGKAMAPFAAFYLGPEGGHCDEGHNWQWLWEPKHWVQLGSALKRRGLKVCVIGAKYDRSFWERYVREGVEQDNQQWEDRIGEFEIGETFAFLQQAKFLIAYQCGLGIVHHYLGGKAAMWWRAEGNSIHPKHFLTFSEKMATGWVRPGWEQNFLPLIYKRETPLDIIQEIDKRGWCD